MKSAILITTLFVSLAIADVQTWCLGDHEPLPFDKVNCKAVDNKACK
ncbi:hypothetical protein TUN205_00900 [Pyrenophora tritici-repentis]|nr:hypothetical protein TUN205_00900 [Pyrenophora tritici-repentis]